jgi:hypothetical protein
MKFKVGDKVKCVLKNSYGLIEGAVYTVTVADYDNIIKVSGNKYWHSVNSFELVEETSNYITTKDFIKEVERLGYEVEDSYTGEYFNIMSNKRVIIKIRKNKVNVITTNYTVPISDDLFDLAVKYATTPIEFREEPKKYTLALPNNNLSRKYYAQNKLIKEHYKFTIKSKGNNNTYKAYFTQKEIDQLPNQEFIKQLLKEEVENE